MATLFDSASLVMIPSGYKEDKVYSIKPTDGSGDLDFSRSNDTATRVNSSGLIEKVRTNLFPSGSNLSSTGWAVSNATLTAGQADPNGGNTAMRIQFAAAAGFAYYALSGSNTTYNRSLYIKAASPTTIRIGEIFGGTTININVTTSYQRFDVAAANFVGGSFGIDINNQNDNAAKDITIAFVQIETGDIATDYIATTSAAVSVGPVANLPRLDYSGGASCPKLLLEPQRTNFLTYSEQLNNAAWALDGNGAGESVTANYAVSPDGYTNADRVQLNLTGGSYSRIRQDYTNAVAGTGSVYLKTNNSTTIKIWMRVDGTNSTKITITPNWQRFAVSGATMNALEIFIDSSDAEIATSVDLSAWGAQLEAGAYATSYIPTLSAASTRGADAASKTGISSLIGQTEGTLFIEMNINKRVDLGGSGPNGLEIRDASGSNVIMIGTGYGPNQTFILGYRNAGSFSALLSTTNNALGTYKLAVAYSSAGFVFYVNGVQIGTSATLPPSATFADLALMQIFGTNNVQGELVNQTLLFKTRLTNAELAALTTI